ncbi:flagellar biosynthetic protein FliO [Granulosicoccus sp.]|nr:flagellar biosynthetic protein FliO [Granulosicoccus sp.]
MHPLRAGRCARLAGILLLWLSIVQSAFAEESGRVVVNPLVTLGKLALALLVVLSVFWLFARVMRQVQGFQGGVPQGLKVVSALSVGQRERVLVVQAGDTQLVIGVTSTQINTLHILDEPLTQHMPQAQQGDFKSKLSAALKRQVSS